MAEYKNTDGKIKSGEARLYRILMSEAAHLIWKLRCKKIIQEENRPFTQEEVENRWTKTMSNRLELDRKMMNKKYGSKEHKKRKSSKCGKVHAKMRYLSQMTGQERAWF